MQISDKHPEHGIDSARGMKKFTALEAVPLLPTGLNQEELVRMPAPPQPTASSPLRLLP